MEEEKIMLQNEWIEIPAARMLYMVRHRIMEGDCQAEHGPVILDIPAYEIQKYPVTNAQFMAFVKATGYHPADDAGFLRHLENGVNEENADLPVTWVNQADAAAYAAWIGGALPTQAQWQYAAEGPDRLAWPWGNAYDTACANGDSPALTPVDRYPQGASPFGVMDLCGNAWEWTREVMDDGMHCFALLRGGCHYRAEHFWHMEGGCHCNQNHEKMPLLSGGLDRAATVSFRCVREGK